MLSTRSRAALAALVMLGAPAVLGACGGDGDDGADSTARLQEFSIRMSPASVSSGKVEIEATNRGGETHEFVVVRADSAEALPTQADGSVDEDKIAEDDEKGELEDIAAGDSASKEFDLSKGTYVAFCNIVDKEADGTVVSHFAQGMHTVFTAS